MENSLKKAVTDVGVTRPAEIGAAMDEVATPALVIDLDALERNIRKLGESAKAMGIRHRAHAKTHKSADIALLQIEMGGACGICCQKASEAAAMVAGGISDVLVSNEVVDPKKIDLLARLAAQARILVCVDDSANIDDLSAAAVRHGVRLECLVEIDVGAGRCGVAPGRQAVELARKIEDAPGLRFSGLQAYHGAAQHTRAYPERKARIEQAIGSTSETLDMLRAAGLDSEIVGGAGTGTYRMEGTSGVYNELQCGSYVFMDADYQRVTDAAGNALSDFANSLFIWTSVMSHAKPDVAVCDAGLKSLSVDSGLPVIFGRSDLAYVGCSDEHGVIADPEGRLKLNEKLLLVPGHCDPTCNLHDWYVGVRNGRVECLWPVTARGMSF